MWVGALRIVDVALDRLVAAADDARCLTSADRLALVVDLDAITYCLASVRAEVVDAETEASARRAG